MRGRGRWARNCGAQNCGEAPSPSLASLTPPLPARGERSHTKSFSRRECAPELCQQRRVRKRNKQIRKGGEAPKGACQPLPCLPARQRAIADRAHSRHPSAFRGALAFRRSAAALAPASERQDSAQAALHASGRMQALPAPSIALKRGTSRSGPNAGGHSSLHLRKLRTLVCDARTARERGYKPRPQEPHSLRDQVCLEITSLYDERDGARLLSSRRQSQRVSICAGESVGFVPRVFSARARHALDFWRCRQFHSRPVGASQRRSPHQRSNTRDFVN